MPPARGEVWFAELGPIRGHEQDGYRPVLVVSDDAMNRSRGGLTVVLPMTTRVRPGRYRVAVHPPEGGVRTTSFALCDQIRAVSHERLDRRLGVVSAHTLHTISIVLSFLLVIKPLQGRRRLR